MSAHDPLCPWVGVAGRPAGFGVCRDCDLIWEARADERERIGSMVEAMQEAGEADSAWLAFQAVLILLEEEQP